MTEPTTPPSSMPLREVLDNLREGVLVYDLDGRLLDHNSRGRALLGVDEDAMGRLPPADDPAHPLSALPRIWPAVVGGDDRLALTGVGGSPGTQDLEVSARRISLGGAAVVLVEFYEIIARRRSEKALTESKEQLQKAMLVRTRELQAKIVLIEDQQMKLLELSTPVIQIWDGTLVLPLIGELDDARAAQLTQSVLAVLVRKSARYVIIDLTGVPEISGTAASAILRTIQAMGLLGAKCALTGIAPAAAQSIVDRDIDMLASVSIFVDLQAALEATFRGSRRS